MKIFDYDDDDDDSTCNINCFVHVDFNCQAKLFYYFSQLIIVILLLLLLDFSENAEKSISIRSANAI